jgi:hypothetical protein
MSSTIGMVGPLPALEDKALTGTRRSRLSLHFNTPRVRRWLLVQLVTMPVGETEEQIETRYNHNQAQEPGSLANIVDQYRANQSLRVWA